MAADTMTEPIGHHTGFVPLGTSAVWGGWCAPLLKRNFTNWPITRKDIDDYYVYASEFLLRDPAFLSFAPPYVENFDFRPFADGPPARFGRNYKPYQDDQNIHVLVKTSLAALTPRPDRTGVRAISLFSLDSGRTDYDLKDGQSVVLAAGGVGNAQILLGSDDGGAATAVGNENDQVGRYLSEHPHIYNCARMVTRADLALPAAPSDRNEYRAAIVPDDETVESLGGLDLSIEINEGKPNDKDPVETFLISRFAGGAQVFDLNIRCAMPHKPSNRVERGEGRDPAGLPRVKATCVIDSDAFHAADQCLQRLGENLIRTEKGRVRINNDVLYREAVGGGHIMSTTRMGNDPRTSVTDRDCRVHNYRNLFIAGSSLFASTGYANPTLTIVALAARLGDKLAEASS